MDLENYCTTPEFTSKVNDFLFKYCNNFNYDLDKEQPIELYNLYQKYINLLEEQLQGKLKRIS